MFRVMFLLLSSSSMLKLPIEQGEDAGVIAKFCGKYIVCPAKVGEGICWLQNDNKGTISATNRCYDDHFARGDWGEIRDKHLFSRVEFSTSLLKAFGLQKGPYYLF